MSARRQNVKVPLVALAFALGLAACSSWGGCGVGAARGPVLELLAGEVEILGTDGTWQKARAGALPDGAQVRTGEGGEATLTYPDGRVLRLSPGTTLTLGSEEGRLRVRLASGEIVATSGRLAIQLLTPVGEAQLQADSAGRIRVGGSGLDVALDVGGLEITDARGNTATTDAQGRLWVSLDGVEAQPVLPEEAEPEPEPAAQPEPPAQEALKILARAVRGAPTVAAEGARPRRLSRRLEEVPAGAQVKVPPRAQAQTQAGGLGLDLAAGAQAVVAKATTDGVAEQFTVALAAGTAKAQVGAKGAQLTLTSKDAQGTVRTSSPAALELTRRKDGLWVAVAAGRIDVGEGDARLTLGAGDQVRFGPSGIGQLLRAKPLWVIDAADARIYGAKGEVLAVRAPEGSAKGGRLELSEAADFSPVLAAGSADEALAFTAPARGVMHYRVLPASGEGAPSFTGTLRFAPERRSRTRPDNALAEVTETGLRATVYFQSTTPPFAFVGAERADAKGYKLQVFAADALTKALVETKGASPRFELARGRIGEGAYVWGVTPTDAAGRELAGGKMNKLEVVYDNSMVTLVLQSPTPGQRVRGATVPVRGIAPLGSRVEVNGEPLQLDGKGRFSKAVPASPVLVFRMVEARGRESYFLRHLRSVK